MKGKILKVIMVFAIIASMTLINVLNVGMQIVYAIENLEAQNTQINDNVSFDVTLGEKHEAELKISEGGNLYINLNVKNTGLLKGVKIEAQDANFKLGTPNNKQVKVDNNTKTIEFKSNIQYGNNVTIEVPITFERQSNIDENYFNRETTFKLTGNYVDGENKTSIEGSIVTKVIWDTEVDTTLSTELEKYVEVEDGKYLLQQKIEVETVDNILPKKEEKIVIESGENYEVYPAKDQIVVLKNGKKLDSNAITIDEKAKTITITTTNDVKDGKIAWGDGKDTYKIIYRLDVATARTDITLNTSSETKFYGKEETKVVTKQDDKNGVKQELTLKGNIISTTATATEEQYKGYMYYGKENETKYSQTYSIEVSNTEREQQINAAMFYDEFVKEDGTVLTWNTTNYPYFKTIAINKENMKEVLGEDGSITITTVEFDGSSLVNIVKNEEIASINSNNTTNLVKPIEITIDKDTETNDKGYIMVDCVSDKNTKTLVAGITTTVPVSEGTLDIYVQKAISGDTGFNKDVLKEVNKIQSVTIMNIKDAEKENTDAESILNEKENTDDENISNGRVDDETTTSLNNRDNGYHYNVVTQTKLLDTILPEAKLTIENNVISAIDQENNNVKIYATLVANSNKYDLFKNPQIVVTLPKEIQNFDFTHNELYAEGLTLTNEPTLETNADGTKSIRFTFDGEQLNYGNDAAEGLTIEISGNMTLDKLTSTTITKVSMTYTNENKDNETQEKAAGLKIKSKDGILTYTMVKGFDTEEDTIETMSNDIADAMLSMDAEAKNVKVNMAVINNNDTAVTDVAILGRLGTTFEGTLASAVELSGIEDAKVYYSTNVNESKDSENWTESFEGAKAYKIEFPNNEFENGKVLKFGYNFDVPEKLSYNQVAKIYFAVNYSDKGSNNTATSAAVLKTEEKEEEKPVPSNNTNIGNNTNNGNNANNANNKNNATGTQYNVGDELGVTVTTFTTPIQELHDGDTVKEGQTIRYEVKLKNNSETDITNLKLTAKHDNAIFFVEKLYEAVAVTDGHDYNNYIEEDESLEELTIDLEELKSGEETTLVYEFAVKEIEGENKTTKGTIKITADNMEEKEIETIENNIESSRLKLLIRNNQADYLPITSDDYLPVRLITKNIYNSKLENVILEMQLPENSYVDTDEIIVEAQLELQEKLQMESQGQNTDYNLNWEILGYDEENGILSFKIASIQAEGTKGDTVEIGFGIYFNEMDLMIEEQDIDVYYEAYLESNLARRYISNELLKTVTQVKGNVEVVQTAFMENGEDLNGITLTEEDDNKKVIFKGDIKNTGVLDLGLIISDILPDGFVTENVYYMLNGVKTNVEENIGTSNVNIGVETVPGDTLELVIETVFNFDDASITIPSNTINISGNGISEYSEINWNIDLGEDPDYIYENNDGKEELDFGNQNWTLDETVIRRDIPEKNLDESVVSRNDEINNSVNGGNNDNSENSENSVNNSNSGNSENDKNDENGENSNSVEENDKTQKISGKVWLDTDKNGQTGNSENGISNIKVSLISASTGEYIKDDNNENVNATTDENGEYKLEGISSGKYYVVFDFDTDKYRITDYKKIGVDEKESSNVIIKEVTIEGTTKKVAITDEIEIENEDYSNINMGLIEKEIFDMSLDKYVSKIIIQNKQGTTTKEYAKTQLAKIEIDKKYLANSTVIIEYTINVTNNGELAGYIGDIIDYIPDDLTFSSEINKDWFIGADKNLHNTSTENEELKPGETKTFTLTLTKTMTENNTGTVINTAEIGKATNAYEIEDTDSTPGNKVNGEDDISTAEVIISIKTGEIYINLIVILTVIVIVGGIILLKKRKEGENA